MPSSKPHPVPRTRPALFETAGALRARLEEVRRGGGVIVLVPTMGSLHEGHLSLFEIARGLPTDSPPFVVASIFVNPLQFAPGEDYEIYPRNLDRDLDLLAQRACHAVFAPSVKEMYGNDGQTQVVVNTLTQCLCGAHRPGFFEGVATVVAKLLLIVQPALAVFGQKDAQQALVIKRLVEDLNFPVRLVLGKTVREPDGLALSSRNVFLEGEARVAALTLYRALCAVRGDLEEGERRVEVLERRGRGILAARGDVAPEYFEIRSVPDLVLLERARGRILVATAARVGPTRLIDNLVLEIDGDDVRETMLF